MREMENRTIGVGSIVTINFIDPPQGEMRVHLVDPKAKTMPDQSLIRKISLDAPLGKALINKKIGDEVEYLSPSGRLIVQIIDVYSR